MLVVTIHDVAPPHLDAVRRLRESLYAWGIDRATLLAVPDYHQRGRIDRCSTTISWLRDQLARGDEIALHGYLHRERGPIRSLTDRARARLLCAGEAEALSCSRDQLAGDLRTGRAILTDAIGAPIRGYVAPAWLEPGGLGGTLTELGFHWHEGSLWLERLATKAQPRRRRVASPAIGFATRTPARESASILWASLLASMLARERTHRRPERPIRVALHPTDLTSAAVMTRCRRVVGDLRSTAPPLTTFCALTYHLGQRVGPELSPAGAHAGPVDANPPE